MRKFVIYTHESDNTEVIEIGETRNTHVAG